MTGPKISIVTPSYEQHDCLQDNLDSVQNQTHGTVEHIVLDGGSEDGSAALIEAYANRVPYDVVWRSEPDDGQSAAINEGFERASGDIVGWLNSDDVYFDTTVFSRVVEQFDRTDADIIYGDLAYVDGRSRVTEIDVRPEFDRAKLAYRILIGQPAVFFRADVVKEEQLDPSLQYCMDYEYWLRLSEQYEIRHVRDVYAGFRRHEAQKTEDMAPVREESKMMLERYEESLPSEGPSAVLDNAVGELDRLLGSALETVRLHRRPPVLAFDSEFAPLVEMMLNLGPGFEDVRKALRRFQS